MLYQELNEDVRTLDNMVKHIIETSSKRLFVIADRKIKYANPKALSMLGYSYIEIVGLHVRNILQSPRWETKLVKAASKIASSKQKVSIPENVKFICKDNSGRWCKLTLCRCIWGGDFCVLVALNDIDEEEKSHLLTIETIDRYKIALSNSHQFVWDYNIKTGDFFIDIAFFAELGYHRKEYSSLFKAWQSILHPESSKDFNRHLRNLNNKNEIPQQWDYQVVDASKATSWVTANQQIVERDANGKPSRILAIHTIFSSPKRNPREQEEVNQTLKGFVDNSIDGLIIIDDKGVIQEWNPAQERITQIKRDQALGMFIWDLQHSLLVDQKSIADYITDIDILFTRFSQLAGKPLANEMFESKIKIKNDEIKIVQHTVFTIKTSKGLKLAIVNRDITELRNSLSKMGKSEERLKLALAASNVGIWDVDLVTGEYYFSPLTYSLLGYKPLEVDPSDELWRSMIHPDDRDWVIQKVKAFVASGNNLDIDLRAIRKDGEMIWVNSKTRIIRDERNKTLRITGTIADITRQKNIELNLRRNEEELKKNLQQHGVVSEIASILNTSIPFEEKINMVLAQLGEFTNASRVYIFENNMHNQTTANTYEWCREGIAPQINNLQSVPISMIEGWGEGRDILTSSNLINDLPEDFANTMESQDIQSFIIFRLQVTEKKFGYIGFDECTHKRVWTTTETNLLKTIAHLISFAYGISK